MIVHKNPKQNRIKIFPSISNAIFAGVVCTVGSSNIDPLSLLLNLEANVFVRDTAFAAQLRHEMEIALAGAVQVTERNVGSGARRLLRRGFVAWCARLYLRLAGVTGRY